MLYGYPRPQKRWPGSQAVDRPQAAVPRTPELADLINRRYDSMMYSRIVDEYYGYSGFHNYGYWTPETSNQREASENLVDALVGAFPSKIGEVLDVACGMGASTQRLLRDYDPRCVTGINISEKQLATCRRRAPGCRFLNMDATRLQLPDESFDNVLCVEAVFHFNTRAQFLREASRVLKPRGCLALSDILLRSLRLAKLMPRIPLANFLPDVVAYRAAFEDAGFEEVRIVEARAQCWEGFRDHSFAFARGKIRAGQLPRGSLRRVAAGLRWTDLALSNYLLVSARKPRRISRERRA
jgi:MPBQ/MSBQ methyltransferase